MIGGLTRQRKCLLASIADCSDRLSRFSLMESIMLGGLTDKLFQGFINSEFGLLVISS